MNLPALAGLGRRGVCVGDLLGTEVSYLIPDLGKPKRAEAPAGIAGDLGTNPCLVGGGLGEEWTGVKDRQHKKGTAPTAAAVRRRIIL